MKRGVKHLIECHCVLPQYRTRPDPIYHRFVVFSEVDGDDVVPKYAQCNNCGVIHRISDISKSEILMGNDESVSIVSINDIKLSIPQNIVSVLESYAVDLTTWEHVLFIFENKQWGSHVILTAESKNERTEGKLLRFSGPGLIKIEPYSWSPMFP